MSDSAPVEGSREATGPGRAVGPGEAADPGEAAPAPFNRMTVAVLSLVGLFVSLYLLGHNLGLIGSVMCGVGSCEAVQASRYAWVGPLPVSSLGVAGYAALFVLALLGIQPRFVRSRLIGFLLLGGAAIGVAFSAYLTYLEAAVIHAWCQWCVVSAILITVVFLLTFPEARRPGGTD